MKQFGLQVAALVFAITIALTLPQAARAAEGIGADTSQVLCLPGVYINQPADCSPAGPSAYLTQMAEQGITFPITPLQAQKPDLSLAISPYNYALVRSSPAPVYASVEDALAGKKQNAIRMINASFSYISYQEEIYVDGKRVYMIEPGAFMGARDLVRIGAVPTFQGLTFTDTPVRPFGWVLSYLSPEPVQTRRTPGWNQNYTGHVLNQHEVVQVYSAENVNGEDWYQVGPDEWVNHRVIARVVPNPVPPEGVTGDRWIEVNLYEQTLSVYENRKMVFATIIASGMEPLWTRPGLFQIFQKLDTTPMSGATAADRSDAYYLEDVPFTMYYDQARALHGAYWRTQLGFTQSHGCVNLTIGDARWLFEWANEGDWVYVWDPSGETPTDPSVYGAGGA